MGVYRSVYCEMSCEHCGRRHRAEVQFETGDDRQQDYEAGQSIPENDGLAPGESHAGVADRFCPDCNRNWRAAHQVTMCDVLAQFVEQGRLTMRPKNASADHTPEELRSLGSAASDNILRGDWRGGTTLALAFYELTWDGAAADLIDPQNVARIAFTACFHQAVDEALKAAGWPLGRDSLREDLTVHIGEDRVISVHAAHGAPIR